MPGLSGLETLNRIKELQPSTPVVMVTKSEEENIMEQAIGAKIADYLIKPVNPTQILLTLKKNIHQREIVTAATQTAYQQDFQGLTTLINEATDLEQWTEVYRRLTNWELQLSETDSGMKEMLSMQRTEANGEFTKFIKRHYMKWMQRPEDRPLMSPDIFKHSIFPALAAGEKVFLVVIDNFRYDQWRMIQPELADLFTIDEGLYCSILPTATQYARNAIFSGLMPNIIAQMFPDLWVDEDSEEGKNLNEAPLIQTQFERYRKRNTFTYHKINDSQAAEKLVQQLPGLAKYDLNVVVLNFIDMLSHARTESRMVRELASNEAAYRSITLSWFRHSAATASYSPPTTAAYGATTPSAFRATAIRTPTCATNWARACHTTHARSSRYANPCAPGCPAPTSARHTSLPPEKTSLPTPTTTITTCSTTKTRSSTAESAWRK